MPVDSVRTHGSPPCGVAILHGGPGARGEVASVARALTRALGRDRGVLEPFQTATSVDGQVAEVAQQLTAHAAPPVVLAGHSWGAMLALLTAAAHPALVRRLVLIASGPLDAAWAPQILATRLSRLPPDAAAALRALVERSGPLTPVDLDHLVALTERADSVDLLPDHDAEPGDELPPQPGLFAAVWAEAAALRAGGGLVAAARRLRCDVVILHGDDDPHPLEGVRAPLARAGARVRVVALARAGHRPWRERHARDAFFAALREATA